MDILFEKLQPLVRTEQGGFLSAAFVAVLNWATLYGVAYVIAHAVRAGSNT